MLPLDSLLNIPSLISRASLAYTPPQSPSKRCPFYSYFASLTQTPSCIESTPLVPCATAKKFSLRTTPIRTRFFAHLVSQFVPIPSSETRTKSLDFSSPRVANTRLHPSSRSRRRRRSRSFSTVVVVVMVVQTLVSEPFRSLFARVSRFPLILSNLVEKEGRVHPRAIERSFLAPPPSSTSSPSSLLRHRAQTHPPLTCVCVC